MGWGWSEPCWDQSAGESSKEDCRQGFKLIRGGEGARVGDVTRSKVKERVQVREEAKDVPIGGVTANRVQVKAGMKAFI